MARTLWVGLLGFLLSAVGLVAQPRVEELRPLARAVRDAEALLDQGSYALALDRLQSSLDSATLGEDRSDALYLLARANFMARRYRSSLVATRDILLHYPSDPRASQLLYMQGVSAYEEGAKQEAERAFRNVIAREKERVPESTYWVARIQAERLRYDTAELYADRSIAALPHEFTDDATYLSAWIKEGRNQIDTAADLYRHLLNTYPESELGLDAQLRLGVIEARRRRYEPAITLLNSLTPQSRRQREEQLFYLAEASSALGRDREALDYYSSYLREFPQSPRDRSARYGVGWSQLRLKRWDEAIATFRQLEDDIDSIAAAAGYQIGAIQTMQGDTAGAMKTFQALVYKLPYESFSDNAYYQIGRIHYRRRGYDSASWYLLKAARQFPESEIRAESYYLLGESYASMNQYSNAAYNFARSRKVGQTGDLYNRALYREGVMLYKNGQFNSAIDRLRDYVAHHGDGLEIEDATFWLGESLYQNSSFDEAERYLNVVVERYDESRWREEAMYGLAWARFRQKEFKGAAAAFEAFMKSYPNSDRSTEAAIRLADAYRYMGQYDRAIAVYESVGGSEGKGARAEEARVRLAEAFLEMGDFDRAINTFRNLIRFYPSSVRRDVYAYNIGTIYRGQQKDSVAIDEMQRFVLDYPQSALQPQAYFTIGDAYYNMEEYDSAYAYYYAVLERFPNSSIVPEALDAIKFTLDALDRGDEAVAVIDSFTARNPNRLPGDSLALRKGSILFGQGEFPAAIAIYRELIEEFPESATRPEALYQIGRSYENMGSRDSAILAYTAVLDSFPQSSAAPAALLERASLKLRARAYGDAAADYDLFIARFKEAPRQAEARYSLGEARLALGDTTSALEQFDALLDSNLAVQSDDYVDRGRLLTARILANRGRAERALDVLASIVARRLDEIAAEAQMMRGELMIATNDLGGALAELKKLISNFTDYPHYTEPGMLLLGKVYEQLTNYGTARDIYSTLIAQTSDPKLKAEAEARLKKIGRK